MIPTTVPDISSSSSIAAPTSVKLLIFAVAGTRFGVEANRIREILNLEQAKKRGLEVPWFHELVPCGKTDPEYKTPRVLVLKPLSAGDADSSTDDFDQTLQGVVIDQPDDFINVTTQEIQDLPPLMKISRPSKIITGGIVFPDEILLLVDFARAANPTRLAGIPGT